MMSNPPAPPENLLIARRALEGVQGFHVIEDWIWYDMVLSWVLHCSLTVPDCSNGPILSTTDWYITTKAEYPFGEIKFFPANSGGICQTFPHQQYNGRVVEDLPWRSGCICVDRPLRSLGRNPWSGEIYRADIRLKEYIERALKWILAASRNDLVRDGEPYELPDFDPQLGKLFAFSESLNSFNQWREFSDCMGDSVVIKINKNDFAVIRFNARNQQKYILPKWGNVYNKVDQEEKTGVWLYLDQAPIIHPWQTPQTFGELRECCLMQGVDLDGLLEQNSKKLRDKERHLLLIGFPIPVFFGEKPSRMHWQALNLPTLSYGNKSYRGFRPKEKGYHLRDRRDVLTNDRRIDWMISENWDIEQLSTRGRFRSGLTQKRILIIGAGALGSIIAELLVRGGCSYITIIDPDMMKAGNLARHTLTLNDLNQPKAEAVANRLSQANPQVQVVAICDNFPPRRTVEKETCNDCDVILDCTGSDEVLHSLSDFPWSSDKAFYSFSLGYGAKRLFCFHAWSNKFPNPIFQSMLQPWLDLERSENPDAVMPMEGIGCWHPVFPSRNDDTWLLASSCVKWLEGTILNGQLQEHRMVIFEQVCENGLFAGIDLKTVL
jgi:hypothetical protein